MAIKRTQQGLVPFKELKRKIKWKEANRVEVGNRTLGL